VQNIKLINRLDGVDLLRGLAIFFVLMNHVNMRLYLAKIPYTAGIPDALVSALVWNGQFGVQIFFAISGFLITLSSLQRWGKLSQVELPDFYFLRFTRIAPLLLLLLAILCVLHALQLKDFTITAEHGGLWRALVAALTFHVNLLEAQRGYLPGNWDILWSLSIEEMFYLFFPLLCRCLRSDNLLISALLVFIVLGPLGRTVFAHDALWQEYSYLGGMDAIAFGCITAILVTHIRFSFHMLCILASSEAAILIIILGFSRTVYLQELSHYGLDMTLLAIGTCMMIATAAQTKWKSPRILRPLLILGQRSYEIYLTHMFVVYVLFNLFISHGKPMVAVPMLFAAVILMAGVLGYAAARLYSDPLNRLLRNHLSARRAPFNYREIVTS
jgi:peptidoglycan/LPS O-acetylase OafA/YrhL